MIWLKANAPILFSKVFWGYTLTGIAKVIAFYGWVDEGVMNIVAEYLFAITSVNVVWKAASKISKQ
jgi:hypothetical protein